MMEWLRITLIKWNVAPLFFAGVIVYALLDITTYYKTAACVLPEWHVAAIFVYMGGLATLVSKIYGSLQKNRGDKDESID